MTDITNSMTAREANEALERMVDTFGMARTLDALNDICTLKAVHIAENWQDTTLAKAWDRAGRRIESAATAVRREDI